MDAFLAPEYQPDATIRIVPYRIAGSARSGWLVSRAGHDHLRLGPGYERLQVSHCGVCSTDLARQHLPFPLPQITGHEIVAVDDAGRPVVVEINASCRGRRLARQEWCVFCAASLDTHCRARLVLGIHDLPGGFSPWILAPIDNVHAVPDGISPATATLIEPFAAALQAVHALDLADCARVAVLGSGRLGLLVVAALAATRARSNGRYEIVAIARRASQQELARALGADDTIDAADAATRHDLAEIVIEATGHPRGLEAAIRLATREVHVKSTTGQPTLGLTHLTELVVDEMTLAPLETITAGVPRLPSPPATIAALLGDAIPAGVRRQLQTRGLRTIRGSDAAEIADAIAADPDITLGSADLAVVTSLRDIDAAIRPRAGTDVGSGTRIDEQVGNHNGLVRARGTIHVVDVGQPRAGVLAALLDGGLRISTSRCGDFRRAIEILGDPALDLGTALGERLISHTRAAARLGDAFALAAQPEAIKVAVTHGDSLLR
jgi:threonine dehydrogenase-like Zn-dependent dehydrogenase